MKICIVYDSEGGHTEALAKAIASGAELSGEATVYVKHVEEADGAGQGILEQSVQG